MTKNGSSRLSEWRLNGVVVKDCSCALCLLLSRGCQGYDFLLTKLANRIGG
jgi:hypothetical protein